MFQPFLRHLEGELFKRFDLKNREIDPEMEFMTSKKGKSHAMIESWSYECPELRKVRYTYISAGNAVQVFNSVIYPGYQYDMPLLGIDFLCFGNKKIVVVLDFQPLFRDEAYMQKYIEPMKAIRDRYLDLAQEIPMKFYDASQYFSPYLLFVKTEEKSMLERLSLAYSEYLSLYFSLLEGCETLTEAEQPRIVEAHQAYDRYSAERDPAGGLFSSYFGHEWSEKFMHEFLFEDALQDRLEEAQV